MKGLPRSLSRGDPQVQEVVKRTFVVKNGLLTVDGATGVGFGSLVVGGLPEGNILLLGAVSYMQFTGPTSADLDDTWEGDYSVGSTPADDATLTAGDVDLVGSTPIAAATLEASPRTRGVVTAALVGTVLDNTAGALELNLSMLVDDAHIGADGIVMTVNGELTLLYSVLQDD
jgi:hypothetical protein